MRKLDSNLSFHFQLFFQISALELSEYFPRRLIIFFLKQNQEERMLRRRV